MEEQAQSLTDRTTAAFQQGAIPPTPTSAPPPAGERIPAPPSLLGPPRPGMKPEPHMGVGPAPAKRPPMGGQMPRMPEPPLMRPPARPMTVPTRPGMTGTDR
uniref:Uncharacterized protein n=1 Tax=Microcebus murinus TaxID=30608 RepID=A0A8C5VG84_MICMU